MKYAREPEPQRAKESGSGGRALSGLALMATIAFGVIFYIYAVTLTPIKVNNSLAYLSPEVTALSMQPAVSERLAERSFKVVVDGKESTFRLGDYDFTASPDSDGSSRQEEWIDPNGKKTLKTVTTIGSLCFNETAVRRFINQLAKEYGTPMIEPYYEIDGDKMTIHKGTDGVGIDFNELIAAVIQRVKTGDSSPLTMTVDTLTAPPVNIDKIYTEVHCTASDARADEDSAGNVKFTSEVVGKDFDVEAAKRAVAQDAESWVIPLTLSYPSLSLRQVRAPYCLDELSTCTTSYGGSSAARANNVERAADRINTYGDFTDGYILQPGEEFSFNDTVGERTEANGFQMAPVYISSGSVDGFGGGICQVSTTLYCAALYANLEITERHNHLYVIHYWPTEGCDATVDWGHLDFKLKNNKEYPIKIRFTHEKRKLTATITGTEDGITAKMESEVTDTIPYKVIYKRPDSEHPDGSKSGGDRGYRIRVWRVVFKDGKQISKEKESYNYYNPLDKTLYTSELPEGMNYS